MVNTMQAGGHGSLQLLQDQGLFHIVKEQGSPLQAFCNEQYAFCTRANYLMLLSYFVGISFSVQFSQILLTGRLPYGEVIAETHLVLIIVPLVLLGEPQGMEGNLFKSAKRHAFLLLICSLGSQITGVRAEPQSEAEIQNCICSAPNAGWVISDEVLKALAVTIFAAMTTIGVAVAGRMFKSGPPVVPTIPEAVPEVPAIPAAVEALPIIPLVEGDDIDDVLARAPTPTRLNSPLSWL